MSKRPTTPKSQLRLQPPPPTFLAHSPTPPKGPNGLTLLNHHRLSLPVHLSLPRPSLPVRPLPLPCLSLLSSPFVALTLHRRVCLHRRQVVEFPPLEPSSSPASTVTEVATEAAPPNFHRRRGVSGKVSWFWTFGFSEY
ncbi:hypothetical protein PIB30_091635 [Stylosanthes scabra]|uniref:Uncharacterized protein n=1 Tax=Stylosanthes scabra TaxID=79078 RepID=A0ABU6TU12_9FABA|nr:hypothetical protein [Stylosanthes scabra]